MFTAIFSVWIPLIMIKLTIVCVNPWILLMFKIATLKLNKCKNKNKDNTSQIDKFTLEMSDLYSDVTSISNFPNYSSMTTHDNITSNIENNNDNKKRMIDIDSEHAMIATKIQLSIYFGIISPFLIIIAILSIISNYHCFKIMKFKCNFVIKNEHHRLPVYMLKISLFMHQVFMLLFCKSVFKQNVFWSMACGIAAVDACFLLQKYVKTFCKRN